MVVGLVLVGRPVPRGVFVVEGLVDKGGKDAGVGVPVLWGGEICGDECGNDVDDGRGVKVEAPALLLGLEVGLCGSVWCGGVGGGAALGGGCRGGGGGGVGGEGDVVVEEAFEVVEWAVLGGGRGAEGDVAAEAGAGRGGLVDGRAVDEGLHGVGREHGGPSASGHGIGETQTQCYHIGKSVRPCVIIVGRPTTLSHADDGSITPRFQSHCARSTTHPPYLTAHPTSSASRFRFISLDTLCCAASCFASSAGTLDAGDLDISDQRR